MQIYVTFKIIESRDGDFILYLHNHDQKLISEQLRSKDLDEVVDELKSKMRYRKHFMGALGNYVPVMERVDRLEDKYPEGKEEDFPVDWIDPLDLYGVYLWELIEPDLDLDKERMDLQDLIDEKGSEWVWKNRQRLVAERIFMRDF